MPLNKGVFSALADTSAVGGGRVALDAEEGTGGARICSTAGTLLICTRVTSVVTSEYP
ncbi:MAG: hypothetical protein H6988_05100 [Pseudomonadales bacterium]|nr:hypothetical protein [Pseudomonadales bacterium]